MESLIDDYVQALIHEIRQVGQAAPKLLPVHTVFFGMVHNGQKIS